MEVETFEVTEMSSEIEAEELEAPEELLELAKKLGLRAQEGLIQPDPQSAPKLNPYRQMTKEEFRVYKTLFSIAEALDQYAASVIPIKVLQVASHATSLELYTRLEVWHSDYRNDLLLVGKIDYSTYHILARWGRTLEPFSDLKKEAAEIFKNKNRIILEEVADKVQKDLRFLERASESQILSIEEIYYSGISR